MPRRDPPVSQDPHILLEQVTPEMLAAVEARELARTEELTRRLASAQDLDEAGAFDLGYDVRAAGRKIHKDVEPFEPSDPRRAAYAQGSAMALAEGEARVEQVKTALRAFARKMGH
ncbi:hypothetical protein FFK22_039785 [Mycobacterium sp. KBS0706]|uniref:hypothetical protein n=1 Tax=Mycobacterium sp. KBS0706 TaxID=2578109 RepID=UPI00110FECCD|nr:hypothetical protein [Mycobacterium sp. KBS0706]TSD83051.1 hypothetical protein FFK22_039785 [Mycobacterium sp. KBS0706]